MPEVLGHLTIKLEPVAEGGEVGIGNGPAADGLPAEPASRRLPRIHDTGPTGGDEARHRMTHYREREELVQQRPGLRIERARQVELVDVVDEAVMQNVRNSKPLSIWNRRCLSDVPPVFGTCL
jgi:hypothetical protein